MRIKIFGDRLFGTPWKDIFWSIGFGAVWLIFFFPVIFSIMLLRWFSRGIIFGITIPFRRPGLLIALLPEILLLAWLSLGLFGNLGMEGIGWFICSLTVCPILRILAVIFFLLRLMFYLGTESPKEATDRLTKRFQDEQNRNPTDAELDALRTPAEQKKWKQWNNVSQRTAERAFYGLWISYYGNF
ncbi:MAG: hypothetical protein FWE67_09595 [Planctomycetaceae bacterium]|nr:hypothetical protein [Planctomycetaceae bacterium]